MSEHARRLDSGDSSVPYGVRATAAWAWRLLVITAAVIAVTWGLRYLSEVIVPVVIAVLLAALLAPVHRRLDRFLPRSLAALITVLGTVAVVGGLLTIVGRQFSQGFGDFTSQLGEGLGQIRQWVTSTFGITDEQYTQYFDQLRDQFASGDGLGAVAAKAGLTATHLVAGLFIALLSMFFFLMEGEHIWAWLVRLFPRDARARVTESGAIAWSQLSAFTRATVLVAAADAVGITLGALVLGVPFVGAIGLLVFIGAFIPIIGALLSGAVAVILALVAKGPIVALLMLGVVVAVQQVESHVLQPFLLGRAVRVHPLAVILAIASGVVVAGIVGALIAVPLAAVVNAVGHHLLADRPGDEPRPDVLVEEEDVELPGAPPHGAG